MCEDRREWPPVGQELLCCPIAALERPVPFDGQALIDRDPGRFQRQSVTLSTVIGRLPGSRTRNERDVAMAVFQQACGGLLAAVDVVDVDDGQWFAGKVIGGR